MRDAIAERPGLTVLAWLAKIGAGLEQKVTWARACAWAPGAGQLPGRSEAGNPGADNGNTLHERGSCGGSI